MKPTLVHDKEKNSQCRATWEEKKSQDPHPRRKKTEKAALPSSANKPGTAHQNLLKRKSLNHQYKELSRIHQDIVDEPEQLLTDPAWRPNREADVQMFLSVPGITSKEQLPEELRNLTLALIADRFLYSCLH